MRAVKTDDTADLVRILDEDTELIEWVGAINEPIQQFARHVLDSRRLVSDLTLIVEISDDPTELAAHADLPGWLRDLPGARDCLQAASDWIDYYATLFDARQVGLRLSDIRRPMCPRFHVDSVPCRMIAPLAGVGTEWIAADEVDRHLLEHRAADVPNPAGAPILAGGSIRQLAPGSIGFFKGCMDDWGVSPGVTHRSPPQDAPRLLLTLDRVA